MRGSRPVGPKSPLCVGGRTLTTFVISQDWVLWHLCDADHPALSPPHKQGAIGPKGIKGGSPRQSPEGVFWSKSLKIARNSATNVSKGYSGPPESIPMVSPTFHFSRILGRFYCALSALFSKIRPQKIKNPPSPGGPPGRLKEGFGPAERKPRICPLGNEIGGLDKLSGAWIRILELGQEIWTLD